MDTFRILLIGNINPKVSDVYNIFNVWGKTNLEARHGKDVDEELNDKLLYTVMTKREHHKLVCNSGLLCVGLP